MNQQHGCARIFKMRNGTCAPQRLRLIKRRALPILIWNFWMIAVAGVTDQVAHAAVANRGAEIVIMRHGPIGHVAAV